MSAASAGDIPGAEVAAAAVAGHRPNATKKQITKLDRKIRLCTARMD